MNRLFFIVIIFITFNAAVISADDFSTVAPSTIDLTLGQGEMVTQNVTLTIHPFCFRPFDVDVVASDPDARMTNLTGILLNGCGGDTTTFEVGFMGSDVPQIFELQFVDAVFGGVLGSIPVTINTSAVNVEPLLGLFIQYGGIVFQVSSTGCTTKEDFQLEVLESFPLQLRLIRLNEDPCDAYLPLGARIRFSYRELGIRPGDQLRVVNPLDVVEVPMRPAR
jgi:hypothetical protein